MNRIQLALPVAAVLFGGCYSEDLTIENLVGRIIIDREAATRTLLEDDGAGGTIERELTDVGFIGPVYVGLYSSLDYTIEDYPHPRRGPQFEDGGSGEGDTYPYGGTTVGDIRYACFEFFTCRLTSNRFTDFDAIVDWFTDTLGDPPTDALGRPIGTGEFIRQTCFQLLEVTSDEELRITPPDRDGDGAITASDLDFVENEDGDFEGEFVIPQAEFFAGMTAWAFMDAPSAFNFEFATCNDGDGYFESTYNRRFQAGLQWPNVLNSPSTYIGGGDWVSAQGAVWDDAEGSVDIHIDFQVGVDEIEQLVVEE